MLYLLLGESWKPICIYFYRQGLNINSGHYWAHCRLFSDISWYKYDDTRYELIRGLPVGLEDVYGIIYQREAMIQTPNGGDNITKELDYLDDILKVHEDSSGLPLCKYK